MEFESFVDISASFIFPNYILFQPLPLRLNKRKLDIFHTTNQCKEEVYEIWLVVWEGHGFDGVFCETIKVAYFLIWYFLCYRAFINFTFDFGSNCHFFNFAWPGPTWWNPPCSIAWICFFFCVWTEGVDIYILYLHRPLQHGRKNNNYCGTHQGDHLFM